MNNQELHAAAVRETYDKALKAGIDHPQSLYILQEYLPVVRRLIAESAAKEKNIDRT